VEAGGVGVLFAGTLALIRRFVERRDDRRLALVLALFACSPVAAVVDWGELGDAGAKLQVDFVTGELWAGAYLWGTCSPRSRSGCSRSRCWTTSAGARAAERAGSRRRRPGAGPSASRGRPTNSCSCASRSSGVVSAVRPADVRSSAAA